MISIDTNVLVRILINDKEIKHVKAARDLVLKKKQVYLTQVVQVELVWVLQRAYQLNRQQITTLLTELHTNAAFTLENENIFYAALEQYAAGNADFSDYIILEQSKQASKLPVYTFDKKFAKSKQVVLI